MNEYVRCAKCGKNIYVADNLHETLSVAMAMRESDVNAHQTVAICLDCVGDRSCDDLKRSLDSAIAAVVIKAIKSIL
jgi:predicted nucleic-acid-binding Zn-ribbon protein